MTNPFEKRATEYLRDDSAFLSVVTPEPLHTFLERHAKTGALFDRLCMVVGTPGSGKTTIATLMQYQTVHTLINSPNLSEFTRLHDALSECQIIQGGAPKILGCRIPMESEFRDIWELPYNEEVKFGLLRSFLQSRAVISWINSLKATGRHELADISIVYRDAAHAAKESIGGSDANGVLQKAKEMERVIYDINAALVPPSEDKLPSACIAPYHPFDAIEYVLIRDSLPHKELHLRPLVILDDVHALHPRQLILMRDWLAKREMKVSRWMLMRLDALTPESILQEGFPASGGVDTETTIQKSREITFILLQGNEDRGDYRRKFRAMARSMSNKYLRLMSVFSRRGLTNFQDILNTKPTQISESNLDKLLRKVDAFQKRYNISSEVRRSLEEEVSHYAAGSNALEVTEDIKLAMLNILLHRYVKRVPQASLFDRVSGEEDPEPNKPISADAGVADGARIHLLHEFKRPYYYGIDAVCDGSSENAEQFLQLAGRLVSAAEARIIRGDPPDLPSSYQHRLLRERAENIIRDWAFPRNSEVKKLCAHIAEECVAKSLEPNASLKGGPNAFGIPIEQFEAIPEKHPQLAHLLKYALAYNALSIKPYHKTKNRYWVLIELTGPFLIKSGLTFARGGFLEKEVKDLLEPIEGN